MNWIGRFKSVLIAGSCLLLALSCGSVAFGQQEPVTIELGKIAGATEPSPALKYVFDDSLQIPVYENAAYHYQRAMRRLRDFDRQDQNNNYPWESEWLNLKPADLDLDSVKQMLDVTGRVFAEIEIGSRCHVCDWAIRFDASQSLPRIIATELDEIQETRRLARFLQIKARYEIHTGDYDSAASTIRCMYVLSQDCMATPWIISGLVGAAIHSMGNSLVEDWIAQEGSPNLYWALQSLGDQPMDVGQCVVAEIKMIFGAIKAFDHPESKDWTSDEWVTSLASDLGFVMFNRSGGDTPNIGDRLMVTSLMLTTYPVAKRELVEQGYELEQLEKMPVAQVVCIHQSQKLNSNLHDVAKWTFVRNEQGYKAFDEAAERAERKLVEGEGTTFLGLTTSMLLPSYKAVAAAETRVNRHHTALVTLEAIRMHIDQTGEVPKSLSEITGVVVPNDPLTGEHLEYNVNDSEVVLTVPGREPREARVYRFSR